MAMRTMRETERALTTQRLQEAFDLAESIYAEEELRTALAPCSWCGRPGVRDDDRNAVQCSGCDCGLTFVGTHDVPAAKLWNRAAR